MQTSKDGEGAVRLVIDFDNHLAMLDWVERANDASMFGTEVLPGWEDRVPDDVKDTPLDYRPRRPLQTPDLRMMDGMDPKISDGQTFRMANKRDGGVGWLAADEAEEAP